MTDGDLLFDGTSFTIEDIEFVSGFGQSTVDRFHLLKSAEQLDFFLPLCEQVRGGAIVELGLAAGGSTALLTVVARPRKLIAIELEPTPIRALDELIERRGLSDSVKLVYGVDQADRGRLLELMGRELGDDRLDLVIDDASHLLSETTASFETLFPYLRPGGLYVIEDWNSWHRFADGVGGTTVGGKALPMPLTPLLVQLLLARASSGGAVAEIRAGDLWATIERGPAALDPQTFRVSDLFIDHYSILQSAVGGQP
jgi:hypothetical protein